MQSFNKVILIGNVSTEVETRYLPSDDTPIASFRLAVNERYKNKDGNDTERTAFVTIETWSGLAETCEKYLKKGRAVLVEGRLRLDQWEDGDGNKKSRLYVVAQQVKFLDKVPHSDA